MIAHGWRGVKIGDEKIFDALKICFTILRKFSKISAWYFLRH